MVKNIKKKSFVLLVIMSIFFLATFVAADKIKLSVDNTGPFGLGDDQPKTFDIIVQYKPEDVDGAISDFTFVVANPDTDSITFSSATSAQVLDPAAGSGSRNGGTGYWSYLENGDKPDENDDRYFCSFGAPSCVGVFNDYNTVLTIHATVIGNPAAPLTINFDSSSATEIVGGVVLTEEYGDHEITFVKECGDGNVNNPNDDGVVEACDDGNVANGDGCSAVCAVEGGGVNVAPFLTEIGNKQATVGQQLTINLQASDADGDALTFTMDDAAPATATLVDHDGAGTATFTWTPLAANEGDNLVTFTVSDGTGTDYEEITITVAAADSCGADNLNLCTDLDTCTGEGFFWYDNGDAGNDNDCYAGECPVGTTDNPADGANKVCTVRCGDEAKHATETCEQGETDNCDNDVNGYAQEKSCNADCDGWDECVPTESCGDGAVNGNEVCDDSDTDAGDGCSDACTVEAGWTCNNAEPSVCEEDGVADGELNGNCLADNTCTDNGNKLTCEDDGTGNNKCFLSGDANQNGIVNGDDSILQSFLDKLIALLLGDNTLTNLNSYLWETYDNWN